MKIKIHDWLKLAAAARELLAGWRQSGTSFAQAAKELSGAASVPCNDRRLHRLLKEMGEPRWRPRIGPRPKSRSLLFEVATLAAALAENALSDGINGRQAVRDALATVQAGVKATLAKRSRDEARRLQAGKDGGE